MFDNKIINSYVFGSDKGAHRIKDGKFVKEKDGRFKNYNKDSVVDVIATQINNDTIKKGIKIDEKYSNYVSYIFHYTIPREDHDEKHVYRIKIKKDYMEENRTYMNRLNALVKSVSTLRKYKTLKDMIAITLFAGAFSFAAYHVLTDEPKEYIGNNISSSQEYDEDQARKDYDTLIEKLGYTNSSEVPLGPIEESKVR